jgi:hypothetical protein
MICNLKFQESRKSDGRAEVPNLRENTHFSMEKGMRIVNWLQICLCITESF